MLERLTTRHQLVVDVAVHAACRSMLLDLASMHEDALAGSRSSLLAVHRRLLLLEVRLLRRGIGNPAELGLASVTCQRRVDLI